MCRLIRVSGCSFLSLCPVYPSLLHELGCGPRVHCYGMCGVLFAFNVTAYGGWAGMGSGRRGFWGNGSFYLVRGGPQSGVDSWDVEGAAGGNLEALCPNCR